MTAKKKSTPDNRNDKSIEWLLSQFILQIPYNKNPIVDFSHECTTLHRSFFLFWIFSYTARNCN